MREGEETADQRERDDAGDRDDEYEVAELGRRGTETEPHPRPPSAGRRRGRRFALTGIIVAAALAVVALNTLSAVRGSVARTAVPTLHPTATRDPTFAVVGSAALGPAPSTCGSGLPTSQQPLDIAPGRFGPVIGQAPVWVGTFNGPPATLHMRSYEVQLERTQYGWSKPMYIAVQPPFASDVTLRATALSDGSKLWFQDDPQRPAVSTLVLHPQVFGAVEGQSIWVLLGFTLYIPAAGCYLFDVRWGGGGWLLPFAAGD